MTDINEYLGTREHQEGSGVRNAFAQAAHRIRLAAGAPLNVVLGGYGKFKGVIAAEIAHAKEGSALVDLLVDTMKRQEIALVRAPVAAKRPGMRM